MKSNIEFDHSIGDEVEIISIGMKGRVLALTRDQEGLSYRVVYWWNGNRHTEWLQSWEIK